MHGVFLSYHHKNDQSYKEELLKINEAYNIFTDMSVDTGDIDDTLSDEKIREIVRDDYLRDSTVTILLVGPETKNRKHVDWEIYSSMYDGIKNKKSGILVVNLPSINCAHFTAAHGDEEKAIVHPECHSWVTINDRTEYESRYSYMPPRIIDNLINKNAKISIVEWEKIKANPAKLSFLIKTAFNNRGLCDYDLSRQMRRANS